VAVLDVHVAAPVIAFDDASFEGVAFSEPSVLVDELNVGDGLENSVANTPESENDDVAKFGDDSVCEGLLGPGIEEAVSSGAGMEFLNSSEEETDWVSVNAIVDGGEEGAPKESSTLLYVRSVLLNVDVRLLSSVKTVKEMS